MNQTMRFLQQENARLQQQVKQLEDERHQLQIYLDALAGLEVAAEQLTSEKDLFVLLDKILYFALTMIDAGEGSIVLIDEETDELVFSVVRGQIQGSLINYRMPRDEGITGWVVTQGTPAIINKVKQDPRFSSNVDRIFGFDTRSMLCVPLKVGEHKLGAVSIINKHSGDDFSSTDQALLSALAWIASFVLARFERELANQEK